jgi:pimeloyl-ACP methyl ester carboxylesterase
VNDDRNLDRRRFLGAAALAAAAADLGLARSSATQTTKAGVPAPFGPVKQIDAGVLNVGGHNLPQEAPEAFARAVVDVAGGAS